MSIVQSYFCCIALTSLVKEKNKVIKDVTVEKDKTGIPVQTLLETFPLRGTAPSNTPWPHLLCTSQTELLANFLRFECTNLVLLVAEY